MPRTLLDRHVQDQFLKEYPPSVVATIQPLQIAPVSDDYYFQALARITQENK